MASSCRRPEHSAPPEVVSNLVYLKLLLLVNATVCAICFGGVKGSLKTFAWSCCRCFYCQFNLIYSQHIPLKWQYYLNLCYFINATIFETSHTKSSHMVIYFEFFFLLFVVHSFTMKKRLRSILRSELFVYHIISFNVECCFIIVFSA